MYLILQDAVTQSQVNAWTSLMEGAAKWGLGIALAILLVVLLFVVIRKMLNTMDVERSTINQHFIEERKMFMEILKGKDLTINNHLDHLQVDVGVVKEGQTVLAKTMEAVGHKIVTAINNQTDIVLKIAGLKSEIIKEIPNG